MLSSGSTSPVQLQQSTSSCVVSTSYGPRRVHSGKRLSINRYDKRMPTSSVDSSGCRNCRLPITCSTERVEVNCPVLPLIHPGADSWVEGWQPESSQFGLPKVSSLPVRFEEDVFSQDDMKAVELDTPEHERAYREHFLSRTHVNYCMNDSTVGPIVMSVRLEEDGVTSEDGQFRLMIRTPKSTICRLYPAETFGEDPQPEDFARTSLPDLPVSARFQCSISSDLQNAILEYDEHAKQSRFKFGILTQSAGQCTEEAIFSNNSISDQYSKFLNCIATEVNLQGFDGFRGGLDVKSNLSGKKSYRAKFNNSDIMFHVSALMPFSQSDSQQVARKRHIGNDIVCVVFQEEATTFDPNWIASSFLHTYVVVQPVEGVSAFYDEKTGERLSPSNGGHMTSNRQSTPQTFYRISVCSKKSVPPFSPLIPSSGVFPLGKDFCKFFLTLLVNAERSSTKAEQFAKLERRTREYLLKDLYQTVVNNCDSPSSPTASTSEFSITTITPPTSKEPGRWSGVKKLIPKKQRTMPSGNRHSVTSTTATSQSESLVKMEGKGLLQFFRGGSVAAPSYSSKGGRIRAVSASNATRDRSAAPLVTSSSETYAESSPFKASPAPSKTLNCPSMVPAGHDSLQRSSNVLCNSDKESSVRLNRTLVSVSTLGQVFDTPPLDSGSYSSMQSPSIIPTGDDLTSDMLSSSVDVLRRTISALKEERLQLLRDDVAMRAQLAEYQVRECEHRRDLLESQAEVAYLRTQLALSGMQTDKQAPANSTTNASIALTVNDRRSEGMRV